MYGYRDIAGHCVDCMTWDEALEIANVYALYSGLRYKIEGDHIQHFQHHNIASEHQYCWKVTALGEYVGNQRTARKARSNGRSA